jgi:branched-chain amino acid transport system permease protein
VFYREAGQYKASYQSDQAIFPIAQDRIAMLALLLIAFIAVPLLASEYTYRAVLIPVVILSLAAIGLNVLMGYCGQVSLGSGAFMGIGAYAACPSSTLSSVSCWAASCRQRSASPSACPACA